MLTTNKRVTPLQIERKPNLKICLLGYRSNPYSGGQGIYIKCLSKALSEAGHSVDVISGEPYPDLDEKVRLIKLPGLNLFEADNHVTALRPKHLLSYTDFFEWLSMLTGGFPEPYTFGRRLVKYFKLHKPNYDIVHDNQSLCFGTLKLQKMGIPVITTIHHPITSDLRIALQSTDDWKLRLLIKRWHSFLHMQKKIVKELEHIVTVSKASKHDIASDFRIPEAKIHVVHNGIDTKMFRPLPSIISEEFNVMATASADVPLKGLDYLIHAISILSKNIPTITLTVLGTLKKDGNTATLITQLGMKDRIHFHSGLSSQKVVELYAKASCAVVPSIYEGFGLPAGEAMACGVPVVATDGGALPEVVGDAGITVPKRDEIALADAIGTLLAKPELRQSLARKGRARVLKLFSWEVAAKDMSKLYRQVISGKAPQ